MVSMSSCHVRCDILFVLLGVVLHFVTAADLIRKEHPTNGKPALQTALQIVLGDVASQRFIEIESSVRPTYEAFPKNAMGEIPSREIFAAIVRNYFAREHGWVIKGIEPPSVDGKNTDVYSAQILRSRAPGLATVLKHIHDKDLGLSLTDVVETIAAVERLILDESMVLLKGAYTVNEANEALHEDGLDEESLHEVLRSFVLLMREGHPWNFSDIRRHRRMKDRAMKGADWNMLVQFERSAFAVVDSSSHQGKYMFDDVAKMVRYLAMNFGKWQHSECMQMKTTLIGLDSEGNGSVPYSIFRKEPAHASFQFSESAEYLRETGMLDDSEEGQPKVLISNYLLGPSNCIASSKYYYVCCLNECEGLVAEFERKIQMPFVPIEKLMSVVSQVASDSVVAPRAFTETQVAELQSVASQHENTVPLHSAGFKHWLHGAYPNECPLQTAVERAVEDSELPAAHRWLDAQEQCSRLPEWHPVMHGEKTVTV